MTGTLFVRVEGTSCGTSMVKISVDCPREAYRCQRISSTPPQISFDPGEIVDAAGRLFSGAAFCAPAPESHALPCRKPKFGSGTTAESMGSILRRKTASLAPCLLQQNTRSKSHANSSSVFGLWLSLVERLVRDQEAVGSNPTSPINPLSAGVMFHC